MSDFTLSPAEIEDFVKKGREWRLNLTLVEEHINDKRLVFFQVLEKIIEKPPNSRSGPRVQLQALKEWARLAAEIERAVSVAKADRERELSTVGSPGPGDSTGEGSGTRRPSRRRKARPGARAKKVGMEVSNGA